MNLILPSTLAHKVINKLSTVLPPLGLSPMPTYLAEEVGFEPT